jgi:hypothetical protein
MFCLLRWGKSSDKTCEIRYIESNTGKSARQEGLGCRRFPLSCTFCRCLILFLTFISSCVLLDSYVLLADDHVNNELFPPSRQSKK